MSNIDTLKDVVWTINESRYPNYQSADYLMTLFCADDSKQQIPVVGIAWRSPQSKRRAEIRKLLTRLLDISSEDMTWMPRTTWE